MPILNNNNNNDKTKHKTITSRFTKLKRKLIFHFIQVFTSLLFNSASLFFCFIKFQFFFIQFLYKLITRM